MMQDSEPGVWRSLWRAFVSLTQAWVAYLATHAPIEVLGATPQAAAYVRWTLIAGAILALATAVIQGANAVMMAATAILRRFAADVARGNHG